MSTNDEGGVDLDGNGPFSKCDDCGRIHVTGSAHSCHDSTPSMTRDERERLASYDPRPDDDLVVFLRGRSDGAYHEVAYEFDLDAMLPIPVAECGHEPEKREWSLVERRIPQEAGRYPCKNCSPEIRENAARE
ncbi:CxxC motif protein [Halorubrum phage Hardycor1]|nr:CxxC motif protein [Halorubrum phage Hardycor1]